MALYLVGENIDKHRGGYMAETGRLVQMMRGIYVDSSDDVERTVLEYSVRICKYLYPRAYLSAASSYFLGPTPEGKLFITGPRVQRTRIRNLEIIQNKAPALPSLSTAIVSDGMGEFKIEVSSIRQRFLESFRRRSEQSNSIDGAMRSAIATRLIEEYGSAEQATEAAWTLARQNQWYWEGEQAERYLKHGGKIVSIKNAAQFTLTIAWHGNPIGLLTHDGFEWRWRQNDDFQLPLVRQTVPGKLPPFISSLLPEGWLKNVLKSEDERTALRSGKRYLSNISISEKEAEISRLPVDILETPLSLYSNKGVFTGTYKGPARNEIETSFEKNLAKIYESADVPRLSGVQIKAPMFLGPDGVLIQSENKPFTHILKPAGTGGFEFLPVVEWFSLELGRRIGFEVPNIALVRMPNGMPPALLIERFDIRKASSDDSQIALEDFCSLLGITAADKYNGTIEQAARALRAISTSPEKDLLVLLKRGLFAWLIADGDMHLKNLALIKIAFPGSEGFHTIRMAPLFDAVTTVVFPGLKNDRLALKMNGKDNRLKKSDFLRLAATVGISSSSARVLIEETIENLKGAILEMVLPEGIDFSNGAQGIIEEWIKIIINRLKNIEQ